MKAPYKKRRLFFSAPSMGAIYKVKVPNSEGSSNIIIVLAFTRAILILPFVILLTSSHNRPYQAIHFYIGTKGGMKCVFG